MYKKEVIQDYTIRNQLGELVYFYEERNEYGPDFILMHPNDYNNYLRELTYNYIPDLNDIRFQSIPVISSYHQSIKQGEYKLVRL
jgi:hypothetical protein